MIFGVYVVGKPLYIHFNYNFCSHMSEITIIVYPKQPMVEYCSHRLPTLVFCLPPWANAFLCKLFSNRLPHVNMFLIAHSRRRFPYLEQNDRY